MGGQPENHSDFVELCSPPTKDLYYGFCCDALGKIGLRTAPETFIDVVDLVSGRALATHMTIFGNNGLAISPDGLRFTVGSWNNPRGVGVACYHTHDGGLLWHRPDLRHPHTLAHDPLRQCWVVELDRGGTVWVNDSDGTTLHRMRGCCTPIAFDEATRLAILQDRRGVFAFDLLRQKRSRLVQPTLTVGSYNGGWREVSAATSRLGKLFYVVANSSIVCSDLASGAVLWESKETDAVVLDLLVDHETSHIVLTTTDEPGSKLSLVRLSANDGALASIRSISHILAGRLAKLNHRLIDRGRKLVYGGGTVSIE